MNPLPRLSLSNERNALIFLLTLLGLNAALTAAFGFSLILFLVTVPICGVGAFLAPRAGLTAAVLTTILFERFFTLEPILVAGHTLKLYPIDVILVAVFLALGLKYAREGKKLFSWKKEDALLGAFFVWVTLLFGASLLEPGHPNAVLAFSAWKNYAFYGALTFAVVGLVRSTADVARLGKLFLTGVAAAGIFLVIGLMRGEGLWTEYTPLSTEGLRLLAFPHSYYFSLALIILLLSAPFWIKKARLNVQLALGAWSALLVAGIIGSLMRHLWLGLVGTFAAAFLAAPVKLGKALGQFALRAAVPAILTAVAFGAFIAIPHAGTVKTDVTNVGERVTSIGNLEDSSFHWRIVVWKEALKRFVESPIIGVGFGASVPIQIGDYHAEVEIRNMHNSWLAIIIQTGVIGGVLLLGYIFFIAKSLIVEASRHTPLGQLDFVILGLLLFQGFIFNFQPYLETNFFNIFFWVTLGVGRVLVAQKSARTPS